MEASRTELLAGQMQAGQRIPVGKASYTRLNDRVRVLEIRRANGEITNFEFVFECWSTLSFLIYGFSCHIAICQLK